MSLTVPAPPSRGLEIVSEALGNLLTTSGPTATSVARAAAEAGVLNWAAAAPHPIYFVGLEDVAQGKLLASPRLTGWRYILLDGDRPRVAAELSMDDNGEAAFSHFNEGPYVDNTVAGVEFAEKLEKVGRGSYELRLLNVPSLYLITLWLQGDDNFFHRVTSGPRHVKAHYRYSPYDHRVR